MARVFRRPASALVRRAPSKAAQRTARKHKVIMESVTQEKKKLRSVISFEAKAPPGYTFIPAGNPQLTSACKELCRKDGLKVFAVTTTPHMHTHNLSQHVHRIGYHFPSAIVATVCMDLGLYLTPAGKAMAFQGIGNTGSRQCINSDVSQTTINTEARDVLKDLFPNIPDNDLNQIIKTAFQKGQRKVGTAVELPLARRAQLAVVAHIRHVYTDYDRLLKTTSFHEARSLVEEPTLARLVEWRGDDENGKTVLEDVFREVIVISDDEESDTEGDMAQSVDRDYSVEVVSNQPRTEVLEMKPINYMNCAHRESPLDISDEEHPPGYSLVQVVPKKPKIDRRGFSRYQAWDRAINRYRNGANKTDQRRIADASPDHGKSLYAAQHPLHENFELNREPLPLRAMIPQQTSVTPHGTANTGPNRSFFDPGIERRPHEVYPVIRSPHQREAVPEVVPVARLSESQRDNRLFQQGDSSNAPVFVSGPKKVIGNSREQRGLLRTSGPFHSRSNLNPQDRVLPSIETPLTTETRRLDSGPFDHLAMRMSGGFTIRSETPHRLPPKIVPRAFIEDRLQGQLPKRRRVAYYETVNLDRGNSRMAPTTDLADACIGERYIPSGYPQGQSSAQDNIHIRRRYLASMGPAHQPEPRLGKVQGPSSSSTRFNLIPGYLYPARSETHGDQPLIRNQFLEVHDRRRSSEHAHTLSEARIAILKNDDHDRVVPPGSFNSREQGICFPGHRSDDSTRQLDNPQSYKSTGANTNDHILMPHGITTQRRRHYADDFVRTVDLRDPVPLENPQQQHRTNYTSQPVFQPTCFRLAHDPYKHTMSGSISSSLPHIQNPPDERTRPVSHGYAAVDMRFHDAMLVKSASTVGCYEGRFEDSPNTSRRACENQQPIIQGTEELAHPTMRRVNRSQPRYSIPEGRTVVIVD
ncbi:hypothetical protein BBP40_004871 [Aspergillus hancockii]|nr:hypothetical protein BBP40_004871 [Aspergillus hancockii]